MPKAIVWFRNDLRLSDNQAFSKAVEENEEIIPVFIWDEAWFVDGPFGFPRIGSFRISFYQQTLNDLQDQLGGLIVRHGNPADEIKTLAEEFQTDKIYCTASYATYEIEQEEALAEANLHVHRYHTSALIHPSDTTFETDRLPDVFTAFRKKVEKFSSVRELIPIPDSWRLSPQVDEFQSNNPSYAIQRSSDPRQAIQFTGGSGAAWKRLNHYIWQSESLKTYKETRNGLIGADYSSKFSPWLAIGAISPREIYTEVRRFEREIKKNSSTYWLVFELLWRDYFQFVAMKYGPTLYRALGIKGRSPVKWTQDQRKFEDWCLGETGQDFVDANMKELVKTGFMSNRGRQNVASYLTKDLKVDWRLGAAYFEHFLIDYDPCSNYGNWQYIAGIGNDPREDRYFNVASQAERYDPNATYRKKWNSE